MSTRPFYSTTFYMNQEFKEEYYDVFLKLIARDKRFDLSQMRSRRKKGNITGKELNSIAIRMLIKHYVDVVTRRDDGGVPEASNQEEVQDITSTSDISI